MLFQLAVRCIQENNLVMQGPKNQVQNIDSATSSHSIDMSNSNAGDGEKPQKGAAPTFAFGQKPQFNFGATTAKSDDMKEDSNSDNTHTKTTDTEAKPAFGSGGFSFAKPAEPKDGDSDKKDTKPSLFDTPAKPKASLFDTPKDSVHKSSTDKPTFGGFNLGDQSDKPAFTGFGVKKEDKTEDSKDKPSGFSFGTKKDNDKGNDKKDDEKPSLFSSSSIDKPATGGFPKLSSGGFGSPSGFGTSSSGIGSSSGVATGSFSFAAEKEKEKGKDDSKPTLSFGAFGSKPEDKKDDKETKPEKAKKDDKPSAFSFGVKNEDKTAPSLDVKEDKKDDKPAFSFGFKKEDVKKDEKPALSFGTKKEGKKQDEKPAFSFGVKKEDVKKDEKPALSFGTKKEGKKQDEKPAFSFGVKKEDVKKDEKPALSFGTKKEGKKQDEKPAFSFGVKKEDVKKDEKPALSFGTKKEGKKQDEKPAFSFGVKKEDVKKDEKPALSFGTKKEGKKQDEKPAFSFGVKKEDVKKDEKPALSFGTKKEGKKQDEKPAFSFGVKKEDIKKDEKPALSFGTKKEGKKQDEKPAFSFGVKNEDKKDGKPALSFGAKTEDKPSAFSFGAKKEDDKKEDKPPLSSGGTKNADEKKTDSKPALSFGANAPTSSSAPTFNLGAKKDDTKTATPFSLGAQKDETKPTGPSFSLPPKKEDDKPATASFSFGAKKEDDKPAAPLFSIGTQTDNKSGGFTFGSKADPKPVVSFSSKPEDKTATPSFNLNAKPDAGKTAAPSFNLDAKTETKPFSLGSGTGNNTTSSLFGAKSSSDAPKPSPGGFGSGLGATSSAAPPLKTGGFGFGAPSSPAPASKTGGFGSSGLGAPKSSDRAGSAPPGFSTASNAPQKSSLSTPNASFTTPGQRTALKRNLLFTAINDTLYYSYITGAQTREKIVSVGFAISNILLNPSGTLLAVVGEKNVSVVRINDSDIAKSSVQDVSKHISASCVRYVLWNPVADPDATLEILTGDNQVISLGVSLESNIEKSVFELAEEDDRIDTIGEVISFSFGHSSAAMGLLTLYLLNEDGDIFCLSPWMPSSALLTETEIKSILDQAVYLEQTTKVSSGLPPPGVTTAKMFKGNLVWCYDLWRQIPLANKDVRHGNVVALKVTKPKAPFGNGKLKFQGPFVVSPYPKEMYTETAKQLVALKSRGIALFAELFESGRVNILMYAGGPVVCSWDSPDHIWVDEEEEEDGSNALGLREMVLLETIDLKSAAVLSQCLHDGLVHVLASDSVTQVDTRNWYRKLAGAYVEQDMQVLSQLQNTKLRSSRVRISLAPDYGVSTFTERLILVSDQVYECDLSVSENGDLSLSATELEKASSIPELNVNVAADHVKRAGLISAVSPEIIHKINSVKIRPDLPENLSFSMSEKLREHPDMVQVFTQIANHFSRENLKMEEVTILMERRLTMQKSELRRQLVDLEAVKSRFEKLYKHYGDTDMLESLKKLIARQKDHEKRFDKLLTDLNRSQSLPLSDAERKWHVELNRLKNKLPEFEKQTKQAQTQAKQIASFTRDANTSSNSVDAIQGITRAELSRTSFMLEEEDRVAEQTKKKLEQLLHKSQTLLAVLKAKEEK
ncbi:YALIH222S05e08350g1_1 [Yarrowia lipolytica]|nr:YALIH222S05e08350g1_1 [Yarrowia lipolytica]